MKRETLLIVGILVVDLALLIFGIFGSSWFDMQPRRMLSFAAASIGIVTFLGFFSVVYGPGLRIERAMRIAITGSVIAMYSSTVGIVTFFALTKTHQVAAELDPLAKTMIDSFQTVVTVVIGFYFTSSAVVEGIQRMKTGSLPPE